MEKRYYQVANLIFTISGNDDGYYRALADYFSDKAISEPKGESFLNIMVNRKNDNNSQIKPDYFSLAGKVSFNKSQFRIKKKWCNYTVVNLFDKNSPTSVMFEPTNDSWLYRQVTRIRGTGVGEHSCYDLFVHDIANYSCLWYIFAITLMKMDSLYIHCGMMSRDVEKQGVVLTGTGGCGKTSIMMELITNSGFKYMAEDFGIMDGAGNLYDMQKKAAIYQSDVRWGNEYLKRAVENLPLNSQLEWKVKNLARRNPVHFFKPSEIFGKDVCHQSCINKIFYLKRATKGTSIACREIETNEMAERAKTASFREIKELYEILCNIRAVGGEEYYSYYPSVFDLELQYKQIILSSLNNVKCYELEVPMNVNPKDVVKYIVD